MKSYVALFVILFSLSVSAQKPVAPKQAPAPRAPQAPASPAAPQAPMAPIAPKAPAAPASPRDWLEGGQPVNIRLDVSVSEHGIDAAPNPKTLMVILSDRSRGQTRGAFEGRSISVDGRPVIVDGRVRLDLTIQSRPQEPATNRERDSTLAWQNSFALLLESGKPMLAFETSDPVTKQKLSIEVKATILK